MILLKAEVPQNLNFLCLQLRMALVHVARLSVQQLAACISSLIKKKKKKRQNTMHIIQDTMECLVLSSALFFSDLVVEEHTCI